MEKLDAENVISTQRQQWSDAVSGWVKWDSWLESSFTDVNQKLLNRAGVEENQFVLDLGSGTGYPSMNASPRVGKSGFVVGLDLSESMVEAARENAKNKGIRNVGFRVADVTKLLFADAQLDAVFSRFCLMFVPSPEKTLKEVFRILKRGKAFAAAVWGSVEKNPIPMKVMKDYVSFPPPDPSIPGAYRFGNPGVLAGLMQETGFVDILEEELETQEIFPTGKNYAEHYFAMSAAVRPVVAAMTEERRNEVAERLAAAAEEYRQGDRVIIPRVALVVSGKRPLK